MTSTEVSVFDTGALVPTQVYAPGGVDKIIADLEAKVRADAAKLDASTPKGRDSITSLAHKVSRSKTALDDMGAKLTEETRKFIDSVNSDRRTVRDRLDKLRDEVKKPVVDFKAAEDARIRAHEDGIANFQMGAEFPLSFTTSEIAARLALVEGMSTDGFQEFAKRAVDAKESAVARLKSALADSQKRDEDLAELERLRQEAADRAVREEAERIEREAKEREERAAAQAKREAEEKAKQEAEEAERRAAVERERIEREKAEAEERAAQAEADKLAAEQRAKEVAEQADRDRIEADRRREEERKAEALRAQQQAEEAARKERERIEDEQRAEREAAAAREADKAHHARIYCGAVQALVAAGLPDIEAGKAVTAIAKGQVPAVSISY